MAKKKQEEPEKLMNREMIQMDNAKLFEYLQSKNFGSVEEMNEFLQQNVNGKRVDEIVPPKKGRKSNHEKADELVYEAYDSTLLKGLKLVKEALKLNPENVRAITYLADNSADAASACKLYKQAVEIGAKQLGAQFFKENKGDFWAMHETRPYMTARLGYADCLNVLKRTDEAITEFEEMLELNPNDNQGVRYILASVLLKRKKYNEYLKLHKKFDDEGSTFWYFNYALYLFATEGATAKTNKALAKANKANKHVLQFMTGQKKLKNEPKDYYSPGDESEATIYLMENFRAFLDCSGAHNWLMQYVENSKRMN